VLAGEMAFERSCVCFFFSAPLIGRPTRDCGELVHGLPQLAEKFEALSRQSSRSPPHHRRTTGALQEAQQLAFRSPRLLNLVTQGERHVCPRFGEGACYVRHNVTARRCCCVNGFYNNFEVLRMADFRASRVHAQWASLVDFSQGIYKHRWGDAILRRIGLALMGAGVLYLDQVAPHSQYCHRKLCFGSPDQRKPVLFPIA